MTELIKKSNIKESLPEEFRVSNDLVDALNKIVKEILAKASERAKANRRTTILPQDL